MLGEWEVTIFWLEPYASSAYLEHCRSQKAPPAQFWHLQLMFHFVLKHVRSVNSGRMLHATPWILGRTKRRLMHFRSTVMTPVANNLPQKEIAAISQEQLKAMSNLHLQ
jgi:hypothetical protein